MRSLPYGGDTCIVKLVYRVTPRQRLIVVEHAFRQMQAYAQHRWWDREAGGVLMGRHLLDSHDVVVDEVSTPQDADRRSRCNFFRSREHEQVARQRWRQEYSTSASGTHTPSATPCLQVLTGTTGSRPSPTTPTRATAYSSLSSARTAFAFGR
jgi:hypothetical protein